MPRAALFALLFAAACQPAPAVISDISDSALTVQAGTGTTRADIEAQAVEGCGLYDREPVEISQRCLDEYCFRKAILFACR